ncbi:signal peptidase complex subunit 2 [Hydra vulgaris]|uniref:Signal peptidase complex subunit 2 n=1 Tax=Hydra vulgaris TaxID=6087 RepID=A0ABM4BDH1_HYDVU
MAIIKEPAVIKVDKWDGNSLKNAIDDAIRKIFLNDLKYTENNKYVDIRLALSTLGCSMSLLALVYDYLNPFPLSKYVLIFCVLSYFTLMSILTLFMTFIEKNIILCASQKESSGLDPDSEWKISTTMKRFSNIFTFDISKLDGTTTKKYNASFSKCVSSWVDEKGVVVIDLLKADILKCHESITSSKKNQ